MSVFGDFRALKAELFTAFELPTVVITRVTTARTDADRAAGRKGTTTTSTFTGKGVLGSRKVHNGDGTYRQEAVARVDTAVQPGDKLAIGSRVFEIMTVEEINPDGTATIIYVAGLK